MPFKDPERLKLYRQQYHQEHREEINQKKREDKLKKEKKNSSNTWRQIKKNLMQIVKKGSHVDVVAAILDITKSTNEKANMHKEYVQQQTQII